MFDIIIDFMSLDSNKKLVMSFVKQYLNIINSY